MVMDIGGTLITRGRKEELFVNRGHKIFVVTGQDGGRGLATIPFNKVAAQDLPLLLDKAKPCVDGKIAVGMNPRTRTLDVFDALMDVTSHLPFSVLDEDVRDKLQKEADVAEEQKMQALIRKFTL